MDAKTKLIQRFQALKDTTEALQEENRLLRMEYQTKDSGEREVFVTGSQRDTRQGKGRFDLIPAYPIKRLAQLYERGAIKYGDRNWEKGQALSRYLDSAERHLNDWKEGDRSEDHLIACVWNCIAYVWTEQAIKDGRLPAELNDIDGVSHE